MPSFCSVDNEPSSVTVLAVPFKVSTIVSASGWLSTKDLLHRPVTDCLFEHTNQFYLGGIQAAA
jgi:hypothetical protein